MTEQIQAQAWRVERIGAPTDVLSRVTIEVPPPGPNEVRVTTSAFSLNFNDIDCIRGRYKTMPIEPPFVPGMEVVGIVEAAGIGAEHLLGKRVVGIPNGAIGGYATSALCPAQMTLELPDWISAEDAAAMHYPFHLSWLALYERGKLSKDETLIVTAAAGGIGSAAIQLGKSVGARVIALAGSEDKLDVCRELGADLALNYRDAGWTDKVCEYTDGRGVDVAYDLVGGQTTQDLFKLMAFNGRHLIAGFASDIEAEDEARFTPRPMVYGNFSVVGVCHVYVEDPLEFRKATGLNFSPRLHGLKVHSELLDMLQTGRLKTVIGRSIGFDDIPTALLDIENRRTYGKTVVTMRS